MARVEQVDLEVAVAISLGATDRPGFRMGDDDRDCGNHRLLRVNDFALMLRCAIENRIAATKKRGFMMD